VRVVRERDSKFRAKAQPILCTTKPSAQTQYTYTFVPGVTCNVLQCHVLFLQQGTFVHTIECVIAFSVTGTELPTSSSNESAN
jgi:hypothetical protein